MPPTPDHLHVIGEVYVSNPGVDQVDILCDGEVIASIPVEEVH